MKTGRIICDSLKINKKNLGQKSNLKYKKRTNEFSDTQNSVLFAFLSNLSILEIYNKEFLKSKSFCPSLHFYIHLLKFLDISIISRPVFAEKALIQMVSRSWYGIG